MLVHNLQLPGRCYVIGTCAKCRLLDCMQLRPCIRHLPLSGPKQNILWSNWCCVGEIDRTECEGGRDRFDQLQRSIGTLALLFRTSAIGHQRLAGRSFLRPFLRKGSRSFPTQWRLPAPPSSCSVWHLDHPASLNPWQCRTCATSNHPHAYWMRDPVSIGSACIGLMKWELTFPALHWYLPVQLRYDFLWGTVWICMQYWSLPRPNQTLLADLSHQHPQQGRRIHGPMGGLVRTLFTNGVLEGHTIIGYLLLINGDASLARSGWLAMIRAEKDCKRWMIAPKWRQSYHEVLKRRRADWVLLLLKTGTFHYITLAPWPLM